VKVACFWFAQKTDVEKVAELCLRFSPQICVKPPHAVFVEIGKCRRLYSEASFLARAEILLKRYQLQATIRVGEHLHDALLFAKHGVNELDGLPPSALLDLCDPFEKDPVGRKYVQRLIDALAELGIKNIENFRRIPSRELSSRFGPAGLLCRQRLDHQSLVPWPAWKPQEEMKEVIEYPYSDFRANLEILTFEMKKLLDRLFTRLFSRGKQLLKASFVIQTEKNSVNVANVREFIFHFLLPQATTKGALIIMRERLSRELGKRPFSSPIEKIQMTVLETVVGSFGQRHLFHNREEDQHQLNALIAQLCEIYGERKIFQARLIEERVPEKSWQPVALTPGSQLDLRGRVPLRPTHLGTPEKIEVTQNRIYIRRKPYAITHWAESIERISSHWLDGVIDRNYYQVEVEDQTVLWIFKDPSNVYYLHGYFG
jgi:hypothetical protein